MRIPIVFFEKVKSLTYYVFGDLLDGYACNMNLLQYVEKQLVFVEDEINLTNHKLMKFRRELQFQVMFNNYSNELRASGMQASVFIEHFASGEALNEDEINEYLTLIDDFKKLPVDPPLKNFDFWDRFLTLAFDRIEEIRQLPKMNLFIEVLSLFQYLDVLNKPFNEELSEEVNEKSVIKDANAKIPQTSMMWAVLLFYSMGTLLKEGMTEKEVIAKYYKDNNIPFQFPTFNANYNKFKGWIKRNDRSARPYLNKILSFFKKSSKEYQNIVNDIDMLPKNWD